MTEASGPGLVDDTTPNDAALRLLGRGVVTMTLPSGLVVQGRLPTVEDLYVRDLVPQDLLGVVARFAGGGNMKDLPTDERPLWYRYLRLLVATFLRSVRDDDGAWHAVQATIDTTFTMDPRDVDELEYVVLRLKTPDQVTALARAQLGEITREEATAIVTAEAPKTVTGWSTFRYLMAGPDPRPDGPDVEPTPEPAPRPNRSTRRARPRRSPSAPATG